MLFDGRFNIDLLNNNSGSESFLNLMFLHGMYPRIDRPTRITDSSATLIDNIFTNVYNTQLNSGVWVADIADHLPVYTILPYKDGTNQLHSNCAEYVYKRIYTKENIDNFKLALHSTDWSDVYTARGTQNKYSCFEHTLHCLINTYFPEQKIKINMKQQDKPWITKSILNCIRKKNEMYKRYIKTRTKKMRLNTKKYKNNLVTLLRAAEKQYYSEKLDLVKGNMKKTWAVLNEIMGKNVTINQSKSSK